MNSVQHERRVAIWSPARSRPSPAMSLADYCRTVRPGLLACIALAVIAVAVLMIVGPGAFAFSAILAVPAGFLACIVYAYMFAAPSPEPPELPDPTSATPRLATKLQLSCAGYVYGSDSGDLVLVGDWLIFEGDCTSFSIAAHDITAVRRRAAVRDCPAVDFKLEGLQAAVRVKLISSDPRWDPGGFLDALPSKEFPYPTISVFPPLQPMPGGRRSWGARHDFATDCLVQSRKVSVWWAVLCGTAVVPMEIAIDHIRPDLLAVAAVTLALGCLVSVRKGFGNGRDKAFAALLREMDSSAPFVSLEGRLTIAQQEERPRP